MEENKKTTKKDLKQYFKYIYKCIKCNVFYGSDEIEDIKHLCPLCEEDKYKKNGRKNKKV